MEEKNKVLDFLTPGCSQQCDVICQNLTVNEASEVSHFLFSQIYNLDDLVYACCRSLVFIFNLPHQLCFAFSNLLPGCRSIETRPPSTLQFSMESNLSIHDTHPIPNCLSLPADVYTTTNKIEVPPVICAADHLVVSCSIACKSQQLQQFAR